ncbi:M23 family metallopeptidase [Clostridium magnum]|uniref:Murein hydrolase activator NlpD n=1 Tax=Clostridium magnum DSM 2767 TaxID=1121326 RepID=A0A162TS27_9CLOT|nr:M23 family metallopeptidase [Clostridium magnum]KZL92984.1 murein hydrolase activator NlpD precursor [Clostridium magnum DSM 2767]
MGGKSVKTQNFSSSHSGIDISSSSKSPSILAVGDGTVVNVYNNCNHKDNLKDNCNKGTGFGAYGNVIVIKHNDNTYSMYAHLLKDSIKVSVGQTVKKGDIIATMGKSGASKGIHLHFEIRTIANKPSSAVNPSLYLPKH